MKIQIELGEADVLKALEDYVRANEPDFARNKQLKITVYTGIYTDIGKDECSADVEVVDET